MNPVLAWYGNLERISDYDDVLSERINHFKTPNTMVKKQSKCTQPIDSDSSSDSPVEV